MKKVGIITMIGNNFGNRLIEFNDTDYDALIEKYFVE